MSTTSVAARVRAPRPLFRCRRTPLALALLLGLGLSATGHAQQADTDKEQARQLDTVTVIGQREPGNFAIDAGEIDLTQASNLGDVLSNQSGVAVGGGSPVAQKVYVRGFEDTLLNVSIDGAQQPAELYHHQARVQIEPEFIKSIELDAGAGTATQGAGALTGAMKVTTRNAFDMLQRYGREGRDVGFLIKGAAGSNGADSAKGVLAAYARLGDNLGVLATHVRQHGGNYDDGNGDRVSPTGYDHERSQLRLNGLFGIKPNKHDCRTLQSILRVKVRLFADSMYRAFCRHQIACQVAQSGHGFVLKSSLLQRKEYQAVDRG